MHGSLLLKELKITLEKGKRTKDPVAPGHITAALSQTESS